MKPVNRPYNFTALCGWIIVGLFQAGVVLAIILVAVNGWPGQFPMPVEAALLAFFLLGGIFGGWWAYRRPIIGIEVTPSHLHLHRWYPLVYQEETFLRAAIDQTAIVTEQDSDGDPYYVAVLTLQGGQTYRLAEGHQRKLCEDVLTALNLTPRGPAP